MFVKLYGWKKLKILHRKDYLLSEDFGKIKVKYCRNHIWIYFSKVSWNILRHGCVFKIRLKKVRFNINIYISIEETYVLITLALHISGLFHVLLTTLNRQTVFDDISCWETLCFIIVNITAEVAFSNCEHLLKMYLLFCM